MAMNKVIYGDEVIMDITDTTAEPNTVLDGEVFYDKSGKRQVGEVVTVPVDTEMSDSSENAVQNKVIKSYVDSKILVAVKDVTTFDELKAAIKDKKRIVLVYEEGPDTVVEEVDTANLYEDLYSQVERYVFLYVLSSNRLITYHIDNDSVWTSQSLPLATELYVTQQTGSLSLLNTDDKTNLVNAINEVYEKSGEPFRVKNWATGNFNITIPCCTTDIENTQIGKMTFTIDAVEGANYQIVGMIAYEVFDAATGGKRINCWPVCQFTGNGQKELGVRWMCGGTTDKVAKRINAWVLLKHR